MSVDYARHELNAANDSSLFEAMVLTLQIHLLTHDETRDEQDEQNSHSLSSFLKFVKTRSLECQMQ